MTFTTAGRLYANGMLYPLLSRQPLSGLRRDAHPFAGVLHGAHCSAERHLKITISSDCLHECSCAFCEVVAGRGVVKQRIVPTR
jgi:hypothetical protein